MEHFLQDVMTVITDCDCLTVQTGTYRYVPRFKTLHYPFRKSLMTTFLKLTALRSDLVLNNINVTHVCMYDVYL